MKGTPDGLTDPAPLLERWPDWRWIVATALDEDSLEAIRERERTGRPLGGREFLARLGVEKPARPRGRPRRQPA